MNKFFTLLTALVVTAGAANAQITFTAGTLVYTQNFDGLPSTGTALAKGTLVSNWDFNETGTGGNTTYDANNGSGNSGNTYTLGTTSATDRAFGSLQSGTVITTIGARFLNSTGGNITSIRVQFTSEQWRLGATGRTDRMDFQISSDATSLTTGTWTDVDVLDATGTISTGTTGALDGNNALNRNSVDQTINSLTYANNGEFWIRWADFNATGSDDMIGIDDLTITVTSAALPISLLKFAADKLSEKVKISWTTATEINNDMFLVERSSDGENFETIAEVRGAGNSREINNYSTIDAEPLKGTSYYRLRQYDFDGKSESFSPVAVRMDAGSLKLEAVSSKLEAGSVEMSIYSPIATATSIRVMDLSGRIIASENINLVEGYQTVNINANALSSGIHIIQLMSGEEVVMKKLVL